MTIFHLYYDLLMAGIETMLINIANEQVRLGNNVKLLILNNAIDATLLLRLDERVELVCFGKKRISKNPFPIIKLNWYLFTHKFDILHAHNPRLARMIYVPIRQQNKCCTLHCLCNGKLDSDYLFRFENSLVRRIFMRIILLGPPAVGKGTQADLLAKDFNGTSTFVCGHRHIHINKWQNQAMQNIAH